VGTHPRQRIQTSLKGRLNGLVMSRDLDLLDGRPGPVPDIRRDARGLTLIMHPVGTNTNDRLVVRCDDRGTIWISISSLPDAAPGAD
jgi:hypothetical protein